MKVIKLFIYLALVAIGLSSCENQEAEFPDFDYQTVYFAHQSPARTVTLGEDLFVDNTLDNQHRISIKAIMGGAYTNDKEIIIDFEVDESLCDDLYYEGGAKVVPMPAAYYELASDKIIIPAGSIQGGVEVQLTDAFFADPNSLGNNYVIPLVLTNVQGADSILQGSPAVENPDRLADADWSVKPKDYVLYTVKYINPWHANYIRRGEDQITDGDGLKNTVVRREQYVERDEVVQITTNSLSTSSLPLIIKDEGGNNVNFTLSLTFGEDGSCAVSGSSAAYSATGAGKFVSKGEKNSFGGKDRDALYLDYTVEFHDLDLTYATKDTLVVRDRGVVPEYLDVVKQ